MALPSEIKFTSSHWFNHGTFSRGKSVDIALCGRLDYWESTYAELREGKDKYYVLLPSTRTTHGSLVLVHEVYFVDKTELTGVDLEKLVQSLPEFECEYIAYDQARNGRLLNQAQYRAQMREKFEQEQRQIIEENASYDARKKAAHA